MIPCQTNKCTIFTSNIDILLLTAGINQDRIVHIFFTIRSHSDFPECLIAEEDFISLIKYLALIKSITCLAWKFS